MHDSGDASERTSVLSYSSLKKQYEHWGVPTHLIDDTIEFTIFNLKELHQPLPFKSPINRVNFFAFLFIKDGHGHYVIDEQTHTMQPGAVYFTNPGHYRSFHYTHIEEVYLITLSESFLKEYVQANIFDVFAELEQLYLQIHKVYVSDSPLRTRLIGSLFAVLLIKFKECCWLDYNALFEGSRGSEIVKSFKQALEKHYRDLADGLADQVFRVQNYADALNLHPNYLSTIIKSKTGKPISTWIAEKTVTEAKSLLQHSSLSVKEVAYRLGFTEAAHFSNYFSKHTNQTPTKYREQQRSSPA